MKEYNITQWKPTHDIPQQLYLEELCDNYDGLTLLLKGKNTSDKLLKINFTTRLGYRNIDETYRLRTLNLYPDLTAQWSLFKSKDDSCINFIVSESTGTIETSEPYINYIICTPNDILEVVASEEPSVEWL